MSAPYLAGSATAASGSSLTVTAGANGGAGTASGVAAGDAILACATNGGGTGVTAVSDSNGASDTYASDGGVATPAPGSAIWSVLNSLGLVSGTGTGTVTWSGSTGAKNVALIGVPGATGVDSAAAVTAAGTVSGGSLGTPSSGSLTTGALAEPGETLVALLSYGSTGGTGLAWGSGWTQLAAPFRSTAAAYTAVAYYTASTTGAVTLSASGLSGTPAWTAVIVPLKIRRTIGAAQTETPSQSAAVVMNPRLVRAAQTETPSQSAGAVMNPALIGAPQTETPSQAAGPVLNPAKASAAQQVTPGQAASLLVTGPGQFPKAPLGVKVELNLGGTWQDATAYCYAPAGEPVVRIIRGRPDQSPSVRPQSATLQASNRDGRWTFSNPSSPWYGQLTRNTPIRVSVPATTGALRLEGDTSSFASCPDAARLDIATSIDIRADLALTSYMPGVLAAKWSPASTTQHSWILMLNGDGTLTLQWSTTGSDNPSATSTMPVPLGRVAVRATLNTTTGVVKFYTAPVMSGLFTQLGNSAGPGTPTSVYVSTAPLSAGNYGAGAGTTGHPGGTGATTYPGEASPPYASQTAALQGFAAGVGRTVGYTKIYFAAPGSNLINMYPYYNSGPGGTPGYVAGQNATIDACLALGIVPICCYKPPLPYSATDSLNMQKSMSAITAAFAGSGIIPMWIMWQEVQNAKNGISASTWIGSGIPGAGGNNGYPQYYYDVKHSTYTISGGIWYDAAGHAGSAGWNSYFPGGPNITGGPYCDGMGIDFYCGVWNNGAVTLAPAGQLAETYGLPLALFEVGTATNAGSVPGQSEFTAYISYLIGFMVTGITGDAYSGRLSRGLTNGPVVWFNGLATGANWNTIAPLNSSGINAAGYANGYIVPLWQQLVDALAGIATPAASGVNGRIYELQLRNGIGIPGTIVADPQFYAQAPGTTAFTDAQGNAWTLSGTAEISQRSYRFHGEVAAPALATDPTQTDLAVAVTCGGILRRLQQGSAPVVSPMKRAILAQAGTLAPVAYWPMEDLAGATVFGSATGGPAMSITGTPALASDSTFACSAPLPVMNGAQLRGAVPAYSGSGSIIVRFLLNVAAEPANNSRIMRIITSGSCTEFSLYYGTGGSLGLGGYNASGTVFDSGLVAFGVKQQPVWVSMELRPGAAGVINWSLVTLQPGAATGLGYSGTASGTIGNAIYALPDPQGALGQVTIGHLSVQADWTSLFSLYQPLNAWQGETAGRRFYRLCTENNVPARIYGYPDVTAAMGAQAIDTLPNLLAQCETADRGQIFEARHCGALAYRTLVSLLNQSPVTIDFSQGMLDYRNWQPPVFDDLYFVNDVSVTRQAGAGASGATARAYLNDGSSSSIKPPPAGAGDYATSLSVPVASDSQLGDIAGWAVHAGTAGGARYPSIPVDLSWANMAVLLPALQAIDIGDYVQVVNPRSWLQPDPIKQLAAGAAEELGDFVYRLAWNGVPEVPYETAISDDVNYGRADTDGSVLDSQIGTTDASIGADLASPANPAWSASAADLPYDLVIGGERVTVNDVNGPPGNALTGDDAGFEGPAIDWVANANCAVAQSAAAARSGGHSLALTASAAGTMTAGSYPAASITSLGLAVNPAGSVPVAAWFLAATTGRSVQVGADFYDVNGNYLSTVWAPASTDVTTGWTKVTGSVTAPASAALARLAVQILSAGSGEVHYVDDAYLGDQLGLPATQALTVVRSVNGVVAGHNQGTPVSLFYPPVLAIA